ncbi:MAG: hypothetical protein GY862_13295 [Gammaproteobacteria bacterium]|nr:hypothetical protein [Gammaproteobacteria bacterium]
MQKQEEALSLAKEKEVLDILAKTSQQYERYLELTSIAKLAQKIEPENQPVHNWDTPLDIVLRPGGEYAIME